MKHSNLSLAAFVLAIVAVVAGISGIVLGAVVFTGAVASAPVASSSTPVMKEAVFTHAEMTSSQITLIKGGLPNTNVGDKYYYNVPATSPAGGLFTGSLTVMAVNTPSAGKEIRETSLVFQMGNINNQIELGGVAAYDSASPALLPGQVIIRPIVGGTGAYAGATGWAETTHNADGSWKHVFHYTTTSQ